MVVVVVLVLVVVTGIHCGERGIFTRPGLSCQSTTQEWSASWTLPTSSLPHIVVVVVVVVVIISVPKSSRGEEPTTSVSSVQFGLCWKGLKKIANVSDLVPLFGVRSSRMIYMPWLSLWLW